MITENSIEQDLITKLTDLGYKYRPDIRDLDSLKNNFRQKFNGLNRVTLTDNEFARLLDELVSDDVFASSKRLRERGTFEREDGTPLHYTLVDIKDWCKNSFEVINQLRINTENSYQRYDVILLMNGIPVTQIELKSLAVSPRRALQQIAEYKEKPGNGYGRTLLCFMQIFIVSNRSETWYFANNNKEHMKFDADERFLPIYKFADKDNKKIAALDDFAEKFLSKCTLGEMIGRYTVLIETERKLLIMRPYQIYAVREIIDCIDRDDGNGYIWHTTGSGKTLTSFKASTLLKDNSKIDKCVFVVDRKDLDRQTREEFNKFQEGSVEENTNTASLVRRLLSKDYADKVIVTTIQKLGLALDGRAGKKGADKEKSYKERLEPLCEKRIVFIFDECHRSQFGKNHKAIKDFFPKSQLFGFTGTPIFPENSIYSVIEGEEKVLTTTEDIFQKELHAYTITHAIDDGNVLRFHIDYYEPENKEERQTQTVRSKKSVVKTVLNKHDASTADRKFNAIMAAASINDAIEFYDLFKEIQKMRLEEDKNFVPLNIACIFSPPPKGNKDIAQMQDDLEQELHDNKTDPDKKEAKLKEIIADYNEKYGTNHDINNFDAYYQDVQKRIKDQQYPNADYPRDKKIDVVIVVEMLLTGFDSKYLNTLYAAKKLTYHKLIQAFSRTNRVLNDTKPYGNIIDFCGQRDEVDEAIKLFSGKDKNKAKQIWTVEAAQIVIKDLRDAVSRLSGFMASQDLRCTPAEVANIKGDEARAAFINSFKEIQRLKTKLDQYTDLTDEEREEIENIISQDNLRGFKAAYLETAKRLAPERAKPEEASAEVLNLDFELVLFASVIIDYDYIMKLISRLTHETTATEITKEKLLGLIRSDSRFMEETEDMTAYINRLESGKPLSEEEIKEGYEKFKKDKFDKLIGGLSAEYELNPGDLQKFIDVIIARSIFDGEKLSDLFAPLGLGWKERAGKEVEFMKKLIPVLHKLAGGKEISGLSAYE